ncbi:hypothetical protein GGR10_001181 [Bartonella chomelii]|uniref:Uncharacterized protein n=1 Tax=Bartonella chomelii TaxID=236402 RepID=A0ABR6E447_9HYPH|nr:hypothetical protein [Bartonella chomelii]
MHFDFSWFTYKHFSGVSFVKVARQQNNYTQTPVKITGDVETRASVSEGEVGQH